MGYIKTTAPNGEKVKLYYEDLGQGEPVVFIHGWPSSSAMFEYQLSNLPAHGVRCIAYDRRGFGMSSKPWGEYDYNVLADDLKAVLEELDLNDVTLVGFSMGGGEVVRYLSRHGGARVKKVVLISSVVPHMLKADYNPEGVPGEMFEQMAGQIREDRMAFLDEFGKQFFGVNMINHPVSTPYLEHFRNLASVAAQHATLGCLNAFAYTDFRNDVAAINVPTLIIHGDADKTVPIDATSKKTVEMIPGSQFLTYEGAPHGLFFTEKERLNADLLSFIKAG